MARSFKFYGKKRGARRTGSRTLGDAGLMLFFGVFFVAGVGFLALLLATLVIPEWRVNHRFVESKCIVLKKRIGERPGGETTSYRPEILIQYTVGSQVYDVWTYDIMMVYSSGREAREKEVDRFEIGQEYSCWYDPRDPSTAVLVRGYHWFNWLMLLLPVSFIVIGGGGLAFSLLNAGKSAERRAVMAQRATQIDLFDEMAETRREFPHVPRDTNLTNSPGTTLAYRLPLDSTPTWALLTGLGAAATALCVGIFFVLLAIRRHVQGEHDWLLTVFSLVSTALVAAIVVYLSRQLMVALRVGPTLLEISDHPLQPGRTYSVHATQTGRLSMNRFEIFLVCEEKATYRQGTNTRTETRRVVEIALYHAEQFEVAHDSSFEARANLEIPSGAMHSFRAAYNEVAWRLVVKGNVAGWPDFERRFPIVVQPNPDEIIET